MCGRRVVIDLLCRREPYCWRSSRFRLRSSQCPACGGGSLVGGVIGRGHGRLSCSCARGHTVRSNGNRCVSHANMVASGVEIPRQTVQTLPDLRIWNAGDDMKSAGSAALQAAATREPLLARIARAGFHCTRRARGACVDSGITTAPLGEGCGNLLTCEGLRSFQSERARRAIRRDPGETSRWASLSGALRMLSGTLCKSSDALWHRQQQCEKSRDDHFQPTSHGANPSKIPPGGGEVIDLLQLQLQVVVLQEDRRRDQERIHLLECTLAQLGAAAALLSPSGGFAGDPADMQCDAAQPPTGGFAGAPVDTQRDAARPPSGGFTCTPADTQRDAARPPSDGFAGAPADTQCDAARPPSGGFAGAPADTQRDAALSLLITSGTTLSLLQPATHAATQLSQLAVGDVVAPSWFEGSTTSWALISTTPSAKRAARARCFRDRTRRRRGSGRAAASCVTNAASANPEGSSCCSRSADNGYTAMPSTFWPVCGLFIVDRETPQLEYDEFGGDPSLMS